MFVHPFGDWRGHAIKHRRLQFLPSRDLFHHKCGTGSDIRTIRTTWAVDAGPGYGQRQGFDGNFQRSRAGLRSASKSSILLHPRTVAIPQENTQQTSCGRVCGAGGSPSLVRWRVTTQSELRGNLRRTKRELPRKWFHRTGTEGRKCPDGRLPSQSDRVRGSRRGNRRRPHSSTPAGADRMRSSRDTTIIFSNERGSRCCSVDRRHLHSTAGWRFATRVDSCARHLRWIDQPGKGHRGDCVESHKLIWVPISTICCVGIP
jgi:hypothetical protein